MSSKGTTQVKVGKMTVAYGDRRVKRNPVSLRAIFATLVRSYFGNSMSTAATELSQYGGKYASERQEEEYKKFNDKSLERLLKDQSFVQYWQIESAARFLKVPVGSVLFLSRSAAARRRGKSGEYEALIQGLRSFLDCLERHAPLLDDAEDDLDISRDLIERVAACFEPLHQVDIRKDDLLDHLA